MIWENGIETCIISYKKRIASPGSMQDTGSWGWCTGMTQRDGMGREVGLTLPPQGGCATPVSFPFCKEGDQWRAAEQG